MRFPGREVPLSPQVPFRRGAFAVRCRLRGGGRPARCLPRWREAGEVPSAVAGGRRGGVWCRPARGRLVSAGSHGPLGRGSDAAMRRSSAWNAWNRPGWNKPGQYAVVLSGTRSRPGPSASGCRPGPSVPGRRERRDVKVRRLVTVTDERCPIPGHGGAHRGRRSGRGAAGAGGADGQGAPDVGWRPRAPGLRRRLRAAGAAA